MIVASLDVVESSPLLATTLTEYSEPTVSPFIVASVLSAASNDAQFLPSFEYSTAYDVASLTADHSTATLPLPLL